MEKKGILKIGIVTKRNIKNNVDYLKGLYDYLKRKKKRVFLDRNAGPLLLNEEGYTKEVLLAKSDLVIVLGGDGTLLKTARQIGYKKTLVLGVNMGNLGFLTEVDPEHLEEMLERVWEGKYVIDERSLLRVTVYREDVKIYTSLALNDAVINQGAFARLINLRTEINQRKINDFWADGLIVATPTGSTGHSLSAGGPIVHPGLNTFVVCPICPSSLSNRPIVLPMDRQIKVTLGTDRGDVGLTLDGQESLSLQYNDDIKIRRSTRKFYLVRKTGENYYKILRAKLKWGGEKK